MNLLEEKRVVIIGGTSGIGLATARLASKMGARLVITGLNEQHMANVKNEFKSNADVFSLDISNELSVKKFFDQVGDLDYLTTPGSVIPKGPFLTMETATAREGFDSKFWGQYNAAKYAAPHIRKGGAIVFVSGFISKKPQKNLSVMSTVNCAVEGLGRALAIELAPIRVNVISPGIIDTPRYATMSSVEREAMFEQLTKKLPVGHVGKPEEVAEGILFLMTNTFMTGQTLFIEGGHLLS